MLTSEVNQMFFVNPRHSWNLRIDLWFRPFSEDQPDVVLGVDLTLLAWLHACQCRIHMSGYELGSRSSVGKSIH